MTIQEAKDRIRHSAELFGFYAYDDPTAVFMKIAEPDTNYLEFSIFPNAVPGTDWSKPEKTFLLHFSINLANLDKKLSPDEILKYAEVIGRGAEMVKGLEKMHLTYTTTDESVTSDLGEEAKD